MTYPWLRPDELENAIDNLQMVAHFLEHLPSEKKWKWAIMAMHQALYGFAICAIQGTDSRWLIKNNNKLITVWAAVERVKDAKSMPAGIFKPLVTSPAEEAAIKKLTSEFRNGFEHFKPKLWSIEISDMPATLRHVLRVIRFLALEADCVSYPDEIQRDTVRQALTRIENALAGVAAG
jgi:hypothetical protein